MKTPQETVKLIADTAEGFAEQAGVGGMEIAGQIISCCMADPKFMQLFFENPVEAMLSDRFDQLYNGHLTHHATNGEIVDPKLLAQSRRSTASI